MKRHKGDIKEYICYKYTCWLWGQAIVYMIDNRIQINMIYDYDLIERICKKIFLMFVYIIVLSNKKGQLIALLGAKDRPYMVVGEEIASKLHYKSMVR